MLALAPRSVCGFVVVQLICAGSMFINMLQLFMLLARVFKRSFWAFEGAANNLRLTKVFLFVFYFFLFSLSRALFYFNWGCVILIIYSVNFFLFLVAPAAASAYL